MIDGVSIQQVLAWVGFVSMTGFFLGFFVSLGWHLGKVR